MSDTNETGMADSRDDTASAERLPDTALMDRPGLRCTFCRKHQDDAWKMIAGPGVYICDECVTLCAQIIAESAAELDPDRRVRMVAVDSSGSTIGELAFPVPADPAERFGSWIRRCASCGAWAFGIKVASCPHCHSGLSL